MKYTKIAEEIIQSLRKDVNDNILADISNKVNSIPKDQIFNFFTGKGGLHGLTYNDFSNYNEYADRKKEIELGQFFTDFDTAKFVIDIIQPEGTIFDPCCGHGVFANFVNESNFHGCDVDFDNVLVANHLFPTAYIEKYDIRYYKPNIKFDFIITNPPFNLKWDVFGEKQLSQSFILQQAKYWLKDYGVFAAIVPDSYLKDEMYYKKDIEFINSNYTFLGQIETGKSAFNQYEIDIKTKIIFFQNIPSSIPTFKANYSNLEEINKLIKAAKEKKKSNLLKSFQSGIETDIFNYKVKKLLYEIKRQKKTQKNLDAALLLVEKFYTQKKPATMEYDEWEKKKLKAGTVLYHLKNYAYTQRKKEKKTTTRKPADPIETKSFNELFIDHNIQLFLNNFSFKNEMGFHGLDEIQKTDINKILQKKYSILNWEQGVGKTVAGYCVSKYRNATTFIVAPTIAINRTWIPFLTINGESFQVIKEEKDFDIKANYYLFSTSTISRNKKLAKFIKTKTQKKQLILDESDEISNNTSAVSKNVRIAFTKCKYKLLMTGTTVRNNATELFPQLQLLYNNSSNLIDNCKYIYELNKKNELDEKLNDNRGNPISKLFQFKKCFSPGKQTVFGIEKQKQVVYNYDELLEILSYAQITRTFKEVCGDKYQIDHVVLKPTIEEKTLQDKILNDFYQMVYLYFENTGNTRKESGLRLLRQMKLLIKSCSTPQLFAEYNGLGSSKMAKIKQIIANNNELILIGTTTKAAAQLYFNQISQLNRPVYFIDGEIPFDKRGRIIDEFQKSKNGILICTQQSLKSSVNIPYCNIVVVESLQWNLPKISQFYFRVIRYNSENKTKVVFLTYSPSIEDNLMNLLLNKERIAKALKFNEMNEDEVFQEIGIDQSILLHLIERKKDEKSGRYILQFS